MLNVFKKGPSDDERIALLEKKVSLLERKLKKLLEENKATLVHQDDNSVIEEKVAVEAKPAVVEEKPVAEKKSAAEKETKKAAKQEKEATVSEKKAKAAAPKKLSEKDEKKARKEAAFQKKVENSVKKVMERTGWDYESTKAMLLATVERTGCTPTEFFLYRFYELTEEEQDTYYIAKYQKLFQKKYGTNKDFVALLYDKERTNNYFAEYVRRPWCVNTKVTFEQFNEIFKDTDRVMYKPIAGHRGYGVEAIYLTAENMKEVYHRLASYPEGVVEAFIKQHPVMSQLSPTSVNSLRFVTFSSNTNPVTPDGKMMDIAYSIVRIGRSGSIVDNLHSGGMVANVDLETGALSTDGADRNGDLWIVHPDTNVTIKGFKIPYFEEAREMVKEAIATRKVEGYIGWDIAIGENGPMLLEVNDRPGSDGLQTAPAQEKKGMKYVMEKYL